MSVEFSRHKVEKFSYSLEDKAGYTGSKLRDFYINRQFRHSGNGKVYTVTGVTWLGEQDVWGLIHESPDGVACTRSVNNFLGLRSNGDVRFTECTPSP